MPKLVVPPSEFNARYDRVRAFLDDQGLGALFAYSPPMEHKWGQTGHVSYLSGWANHDRIVDSAVVIPATGQPVLLASGMQFMLDQAAEVSPLTDMRLVQAIDPNAVAAQRPDAGVRQPRDFASVTLAILQENGLSDKDVGVVGLGTMPAPFYQALSHELGSKLRHVDDIVAQIRSVKSDAEAAIMKRASQLSDLGFRTMLEVARAGMRGVEIIAEMERAVRREGADHAKYWMASGPPTDWNGARLDLKPHERVLCEGDLMAACSYVVYQGYWAHGQRTGTLAKPLPSFERLYKIAREAQDEGIKQIQPGVPIAQVAQTIEANVSQHGLHLLGGRIGHGIGMDYSEQPVPLDDNNEIPFASGNTVEVHAVYALPETGKMWVPLGDVCHVTDDGATLLMEFTREMFVAGAGS